MANFSLHTPFGQYFSKDSSRIPSLRKGVMRATGKWHPYNENTFSNMADTPGPAPRLLTLTQQEVMALPKGHCTEVLLSHFA